MSHVRDHLRAAAVTHLVSQLPDGYTLEDEGIARLDPSLPDHVRIDQLYDGRVVGQRTAPAPYRPASVRAVRTPNPRHMHAR